MREAGSERCDSRGRDATSPGEIPWQGWKDVLWRVRREIVDDRLTLVAASVAFYAMLALFPALMATVSLYGLLADPHQIAALLRRFGVFMPPSAQALVSRELVTIVHGSSAGWTLGLVTSVAFSLLSASTGALSIIDGVTIAYDEPETRGVLRRRATAMLFALSFSVFLFVAGAAITILPRVAHGLGVGTSVGMLISVGRWPALGASMMLGLALLYRYAPNRTPPRWSWVAWGAAVSTFIWLVASLGFSAYAASFARFNRIYGALGAMVVLMLWFYISALAILIGAELNAELEHQTQVDTTVGPPRPMGQREAVVADTLGPARPERSPRSIRARLGEAVKDASHPRRRKSSDD
jgi:membrane protein